MQKENNYAFIDSQNVNLNIRQQGWILDFARFRIYLNDKYHVSKAFIFIGYLESNKKLYAFLESIGYTCIFKPVIENQNVLPKGNCDAELVLHTMIELNNFDRAIIVTGDGDFYCLVKYLIEKNKLKNILVPNQNKFSALLKHKIVVSYLRYMNDLKQKLEYKRKVPLRTKP